MNNKKVNSRHQLRECDTGELFRKIFEASPDGFIISRMADGHILRVNKSTESIFGYSAAEMLGRTSIELGLIADLEERRKAVEILKANGSVRDFPIMIVRKTGEKRLVSLAAEMLEVAGEQCMLTSVRDISERKRLEKEVKEKSEILNLILKHINEGIIVSDARNGRVLAVSRWGIDRAVGDPNAEVTGIPIEKCHELWDVREINTGEKVNPDRLPLSRALKGETIQGEEFLMAGPDGTSITASFNAVPIYNDEHTQIINAVATWTDVTERKKAEESLSFQAAVVSNVNDAVIATDENFRFSFWNKSAEELLGWTAGEVIGQSAQKLLQTKLEGMTRQEAADKLLKDGQFKGEVYYLKKDGSYVLTEINSKILYESNGNTKSIITSLRDIAERKKMEEALRQSEERFFKAFINSPYAMTITKLPKGIWTDVNESFIRLTGYSREELLGHTSADFNMVIEKDPQERARIIKSIQETGSVSDAEVSIRTRRGELRQVVLSAVITKLNGEDYVITQHIDITERKRAEEALMESKERLLDAQELAHLGSFTFDIQTKRYEWTDELFKIYGLDPENGNPSYEEMVLLVHPDDRGNIMPALQEAVENIKDKIELEYRIIRPDGQVRYIKYTERPTFDRKAKFAKRLGAVLDITEMKKTQYQLERTIADLERFAFAASHDLQEPIRVMGSYAHLLMKRYKGRLDPQADRYLKFMFEGALRLQLLIRDLLNYARLREDEMAFSSVDLNTVLTAVLDDLKRPATEAGAIISWGELPQILAARSQIKQLFTNLLSNAIKFRKKNTVPVISIYAEDRGKEWLFTVEDNGIGIEPESAKLLFNIFQRLNERDVYPGVGIGLAICKRIVERHEGSIWVESEPGKGSRFYFTIPKKGSILKK